MQSIDLKTYPIKQRKPSSLRSDSGQSWLNKELTLFKKKLGSKEKENIYSELGLLLTAGVDIKTALDILVVDARSEKTRNLLKRITEDVLSGSKISDAISIHPQDFSRYESHSIRLGEEAGKLPDVLKELAEFFKGSVKMRRQITGMLAYPLSVLVIALLIVFFMLQFVVPVFKDIFTQTGNELPAMTQALLTVSNHSGTIFLIMLLLFSIVVITHHTNKKKKWYRHFTSSLLLRIPIINQLIQKTYLARFCQSMKLLSASRVVINEALLLIENMIDFYPLETALSNVSSLVVNDGLLLNQSLSRHKIFPPKLVALIKLSEEVNEPEIIYEKMCEQYNAEVEHQQALIGKLLEPVFIIFLGLFVGLILVAMYLPMFEMSNTQL